MNDRPRALLLYSLPGETAATVRRHVDALGGVEGFETRSLNVSWRLPGSLDLDCFDVVLIHYSLMAGEDVATGPILLTPRSVARIGQSRALKGVFLQDEHRNVRRTIQAIRDLGASAVFTCMPPQFIDAVYPTADLPGVLKVNVLTGYADPELSARKAPAYSERPIDVGYRGRRIAFWLGRLTQEKWSIGERFLTDAPRYGLVCDISSREDDRLYGEAWPEFLGRCKAILGTESGASVIDFDGSVRAAVDAAVAANPSIGFEEIRERFLKDVDGRISMAQISPRCFEAAAMKTLMILYEGDYSGRLTPWKHYVPLKKDHGNMSEIVAVLRDEARVRDIVERAYVECALAPQNSYDALRDIVRGALLRQRPSLANGTLVVEPWSDARWAVTADENRKIGERARRLRQLGKWLGTAVRTFVPRRFEERFRERIARPARTLLLGR